MRILINMSLSRYAIGIYSMLFLFLLTTCSREIVEEPYLPIDTHDKYINALIRLELSETELGKQWIESAETAISNPGNIMLPFSEELIFDPAIPEAIGYVFPADAGRRIDIDIQTDLNRFFADVYRIDDGTNSTRQRIASRPESGSKIAFEPKRDGMYLLRMQPELLRGGKVTLTISARAAFAFPVEGGNPADIGSYYGDPRDGGVRIHEGLDIFAPRGTPVLAAIAGTVRVGTRTRGGNVVTLYDDRRDIRLYYAHLDEQLVTSGDRVEIGDVIGTVGNTGNAITTPPHLHIGVYRQSWAGSVDPWNFFVEPDAITALQSVLGDRIGEWQRLAENSTMTRNISYRRPNPRYVNRSPILKVKGKSDAEIQPTQTNETMLAAGSAVQVIGVTGEWARIRTPAGATGYIDPAFIEPTDAEIVLPDRRQAIDLRTGDITGNIAAGTIVRPIGTHNDGVVAELRNGKVAVLVPDAKSDL
jgi:peptidoglycan LD-endopeptidase LytH